MCVVRRLVVMILSGLLVTVVALPAVASVSRPKVVDPVAHQARYRTLAAEWWQWALSTSFETGGPFDTGQIQCAVNQPRRNVLFLAAPFNTSGTVDRTCAGSVGRGAQIFFPVINTECSNVEDPPFFGATARERRACVNEEIFDAAGLSATVDGRAIPVSQAKFDIVSRDFAFTAVSGNPVGLAGSGQSTTRGVWLLLEPLQKGNHTITFTGSYPALDFSLSATYHLTVR